MTGVNMEKHAQTWVKVNALVDQGVSDLITALNQIEGLETIASCQGEPAANPQGKEAGAYVFFYFGNWQKISQFAFETIAPALKEIEGAAISVEIFNGSEPMGKLSVRLPSIPVVVAALEQAFSHQKSLYSCDKERTTPRNC